MPEKKTARRTTSTKTAKPKERKAAEGLKKMSHAQRVAAVEKNIGETQLLSEFLSRAGWR